MGCPSTSCTDGQAGPGQDTCKLLIGAYILAGLAMMLNIRLSYSSAPYALIRFKLPENLFSVFVRRMASALELWCLPSMLLGNIMELSLKGHYQIKGYKQDWSNNGNLKENVKSTIKLKTEGTGKTITITNIPHMNYLTTPRLPKLYTIIIPSIICQWLNFLTYVILLVVYVGGGDTGHLTTFYFVIAISGVVFGINMVLVYAADWNYTPVYIVGENSFPIITSFMHYLTTLIFGNRRKWNSDFIIVCVDIWVAIIISFVAATVWSVAYGICIDTKKTVITYTKGAKVKIKTTSTNCPNDAATPGTASITGPGDKALSLKVTDKTASATTLADETPVPCTVSESIKDKTLNINYTKDGKCIEIKITGIGTKEDTVPYGHILTESFDMSQVHWQAIISPTLMVIVGMGLVYAIYPGIAPGMIVPFYLIDKIEMVLLIATFFPPVIVAILIRVKETTAYSPKTKHTQTNKGFPGWTKDLKYQPFGAPEEKTAANTTFYHAFDILMVIKISLAVIFIYSLHYRDSNISRSIVNQPKMSTVLSIIFYMCHECLLALGFPGIIGNNGSTYVVLPAQYIGALFMIFLAFYSEGYIIEYKSHDPQHWPTEGIWYLYGYYQLNPDFLL